MHAERGRLLHLGLDLGVWPVWKSLRHGGGVVLHQRDACSMAAMAVPRGGGGGFAGAGRRRLFDFHTGSCAGTVLSASGGFFGGGGCLPAAPWRVSFRRRHRGFLPFWRRDGRFLAGGTGGFFWGGGGRGLASFFGGGGGRGGSLASPLGGGLDAAPVPGDGGASLAAASSFSPDHQLDQEPAAA